MKKLLLASLLLAVPALSQAAQCGAPGSATVLENTTPPGIVMLLNLQKDGVALSFSGKDYRPRATARPGYHVFQLEGRLYQVMVLPVAPLLEGGDRPDDAGLLARHAKQQGDKFIATGTPLKQFDDLGDQVRDYGPGKPARTFKLWRLSDPAGGKASQYFLSTVVGDDVVVLNALVTAPAADLASFDAVRAEYVARFRPLAAEDCAAKP